MDVQWDCDDWVDRLTNTQTRDRAIDELRGLLVRGLSKALASRYGGVVQAEDVAQDALVKILDSLDSFQGNSKFTTWAMTLAVRVGISELRRKRYQDVSLDRFRSDAGGSLEIAIDPSNSIQRQLDRSQVLRILHDLIESELSDKQRLAIQTLLAGLPVDEIARRLGSNRNAVYKLIHDGRMRLKAGFERAGLTAQEIGQIWS